MNLSNTEILYASLVGSKVVKSIPRLSLVQNELMKHVLPPIPFLPFKNDPDAASPSDDSLSLTAQFNKSDKYGVESQFSPFWVKRAGTADSFIPLPFEPLVSVSGKNNIIRRAPSKQGKFIGTIKEYWSQDDYEITITGVLFGENERGDFENSFPREYFERLRDYCLSPTGLEVKNNILELLNISRIAVEDFSFPFSKGENVQAYDIKAYSDFSADFLLEIESNKTAPKFS